jgi:hypothetical protein
MRKLVLEFPGENPRVEELNFLQTLKIIINNYLIFVRIIDVPT